MARWMNPWIVGALAGAAGGSTYWLIVDRALGVGGGTLVERLVVGVTGCFAWQAARWLRHKS